MSGKSKKVKGTKQTLEYVEKEDKLHVKPIKCKNARQKELLNSIMENEITLAKGDAGCGKSFVSLYAALKLLEKGQIEKIGLIKSITSLEDECLQALPGGIYEKMEPYMWSFFFQIDKLIGEQERKRLVGEGKICILPLNFLRGVSLDNYCLVVDEAQNLNYTVFKTVMTRIGENNHVVYLGDCSQIDFKDKKRSVLGDIVDAFKNDPIPGIHTVEFLPEDCVRNPLIPKILERLKTIEK